jgi:hypothetical protein
MRTFILVTIFLWFTPVLAEQRVLVAAFSQGSLAGWASKSFKGETRYRLVDSGDDGQVLQAESHGQASGLFREIKIDLTQTPFLYWSWRVDQALTGLDERSKAGDDYAARLYVVVSGGLLFWKTRAINYVWSGSQPQGSRWPNAFTGNAVMIAQRGSEDAAGQWRFERRNVRDDMRALFGKDITRIDAIAIMTDTDNSEGDARASYGDIWFADR